MYPYVTVVVALVTLSTSVFGDAYLLSGDKVWRCNALNDFVDSIAAKVGSDVLSADDKTIAEATAFAFSRNANFSRFFGREYDHLKPGHLKRIRGDLQSCSFNQPALARALQTPFDPDGARNSEIGRQWLRSIYWHYDETLRTQMQKRTGNLTGEVVKQCQPKEVVRWMGSDFVDIDTLAQANRSLVAVTKAVQASGIRKISYHIDRYVKDLDYLLRKIERKPKAYHAPEIYQELLREQRDAVRELLDPAAATKYVADFAEHLVVSLDATVGRIEAAPDTFATWKSLARYEHLLTTDYRRVCIEQNAALEKFPLCDRDRAAISAAFARVSSSARQKFTRILEQDEASFYAAIEALDSDEEFTDFFQQVTTPMSLAQEIGGVTPMADAYRARLQRYREYKQNVARQIEITEQKIRVDAELALLEHKTWNRAPNETSGTRFTLNVLRESLQPPENIGSIADIVNRNDPGANVIVMYRNGTVGGQTGQIVLKCDPDVDSGNVRAYALLDWEIATVDQREVDATLYSGLDRGGKRTTVTAQKVGNTVYTNTVRLFVPSPAEDYYEWVLPGPDGSASFRGPRIEYDGLISEMIDACYPALKREVTLKIPPFS